MNGILTFWFISLASLQASSAMPLFNENGIQEDRGYQTCCQDCSFKLKDCLKCPERENGSDNDDDAIIKCARVCEAKYKACIGTAGTSTRPATGCHNPQIQDRY